MADGRFRRTTNARFGSTRAGQLTAQVGQNLPFEVTIQIALNPTVNRMAVWVIAQTRIDQPFKIESGAF